MASKDRRIQVFPRKDYLPIVKSTPFMNSPQVFIGQIKYIDWKMGDEPKSDGYSYFSVTKDDVNENSDLIISSYPNGCILKNLEGEYING